MMKGEGEPQRRRGREDGRRVRRERWSREIKAKQREGTGKEERRNKKEGRRWRSVTQ